MKNSFINKQIQLISSNILLVITVILTLSLTGKVQAQNPAFPIAVSMHVNSPVPPHLPMLEQDLTGGAGSFANRIVGTIKNNGNTNLNVKLYGRLERMSPSPISMALSPSYQAEIPITVPAMEVLNLSQGMIDQAFNGFSSSTLIFQGTSMNELQSLGMNYKLPEGTYRLCIEAYDFSSAGKTVPLSTPGMGCSVFQICYSASAPKIQLPVTSNMGYEFEDYVPMSSIMHFNWLPPLTTCGAIMPNFNYKLEVFELYASQSINDALYSIPVFQDENIHNTTYIFDTLMHPQVFKNNHRYVIRVRSNILNPQSFLEVQNNGYSELASFTYKTSRNIGGENDGNDGNDDGDLDDVPNEGGIADTETPGEDTDEGEVEAETEGELAGAEEEEDPKGEEPLTDPAFEANNCAEIDIDAAKALGLLARALTEEDVIKVGDFTMKLDKGISAINNTYSGTGYILWKPFGVELPLAVKFSEIKINTEMQLVDGLVKTIIGENFKELKNIETSFANTVSSLSKTNISNIRRKLNMLEGRIDSLIYNSSRVFFPLGVQDDQINGDLNGTFFVSNIIFSSTGSNLSVVLGIEDVKNEEAIVLGSTNLCVKPSGFSMKNGTLFLAKDKKITFDGHEFNFKSPEQGVFTNIVEDEPTGTFAKWDSEGKFEEVVVNATVNVSEEYIVPLDVEGNRLDNRVELDTRFSFKDWNNWIAKLEVDKPFEITPLKGFKIEAGENIYFDHSDSRNAIDFKAPDRYKGDKTVEFMGLYIPKLHLSVPNSFVAKGVDVTPVEFNNFIIDKDGVSTTIISKQILDISTGVLGGWGFTIDSLYVNISHNNLDSLTYMSGGVRTPISETLLAYSCNLLHDNENSGFGYQFMVNPINDLRFSAWKADLSVYSNSNISIVSSGGKTSIQASLNGSLGFNIDGGELLGVSYPNVRIPALAFENMRIANATAFYETIDEQLAALKNEATKIEEDFLFDLKNLKFGNDPVDDDNGENDSNEETTAKEPTIAGFNFSLGSYETHFKTTKSPIDRKVNGAELGINMDLSLDLGFGKSFVVSGTVKKFELKGKLSLDDKPSFEGIEVGGIKLEGEFGPVKVDGYLNFLSNDPVWGNGIDGGLIVDFPLGIQLNSNVKIGQTLDSIKYFGLGAGVLVESPPLAVFGPLMINGFSGGFYNNLAIKTTSLDDPKINKSKENSASGIEMIPKKGAMTIQAGLSFSIVNSTVLKASVALTGTVNNGSLAALDLKGEGDIISDGSKDGKGIIKSKVKIEYDLEHNVFDGNFNTTAELFTAEASIPIWVHISRESKNKYNHFLYVGRPDKSTEKENLNSIEVTLMNLGSDTKDSKFYAFLGGKAYFCTGNILPPMPPLPDKVKGDGNRESNYISLVNSIQGSIDGKDPGFMLGASIEGKLKLELGMFYTRIGVLAGFDVLLRRISNPGDCAGDKGTFGFNNWYASGQTYFNLNMDVGFKVNVWFYKGDVSLASMNLNAVMQAGLPNPTWMRGNVRIKGSVLNGLIKVNANCNVEIGEPCLPTVNPLEDIKMITEVGPEGEDVSVFEDPYIVFSMPMDHTEVEFLVPSNDPNNSTPVKRKYKFNVEAVTITKVGEKGGPVKVEHKYNNDKHALTLVTSKALDGNSKYEIFVKCLALEWSEKENKWLTDKGLIQDTTVYYFTGGSPDTLADRHIVFSYPMDGQQYLLQDEFSRKGVIQLDKYASTYFEGAKSSDDYIVVFTEKGPRNGSDVAEDNLSDENINIDLGSKKSQIFRFNEDRNEILFDIPDLKNNYAYEVSFIVRTRGSTQGTTRSKDIDIVRREVREETTSSQVSTDKFYQFDVNDRYGKGSNGGVFSGGGRGSSGGNSGNTTGNHTTQTNDKVGLPNMNTGGGKTEGALENSFGSFTDYNVSRVSDKNSSQSENRDILPDSDTITLKGHDLNRYSAGSGERVIWKMDIVTSQYNTFQEKMNAHDFENRVKFDEKVGEYDCSLFFISSLSEGEPFDDFELKGSYKNIGVGRSSYMLDTPPLLNASIVYDTSEENDKTMDELYSLINNRNLYSSNLDINLGNYQARRSIDGTLLSNTIPMIVSTVSMDVNRPGYVVFFNERDFYYANDYLLMQDAATYYLDNMFDLTVKINNSDYAEGLTVIATNGMGMVSHQGLAKEGAVNGFMNSIKNAAHQPLSKTDKVQFEYGYSVESYSRSNKEGDSRIPDLETLIPSVYKGIINIIKVLY
ncbi:MAG TPA: hypothetical protein VL021_05785 [Brumimicrobium sp.]|nr:hypothetical protein [Brumimicrobium sp.]